MTYANKTMTEITENTVHVVVLPYSRSYKETSCNTNTSAYSSLEIKIYHMLTMHQQSTEIGGILIQ